ncbi:S1 family peptidase [Actinoalloteichus sp. GBA129-24]|uniref:S1 family peptidase n=1 Tax=Actinoalloteichus sp. GBA129-24 TaxID=1612551 RepID=UPI0009508C55|nr:serine protease [Actinoalloteichus sp. GBA129-24]APU19836.1 Trypsin [Actinoalloteichus sp. GBA129-24]
MLRRVDQSHRVGRRIGAALAAVLLLAVGSVASAADAPEGGSVAESRIVGGVPADTADHPWMAALTTPSGDLYCGGALVAPDKVVTAAHCLVLPSEQGVRVKPRSDVRVVVGRTDLRTTDGVQAGVRSIWVHPRYSSFVEGEDVAVLTLDRRINVETAKLVDLGDDRLYSAGTPATTLGWGRTSENGTTSPTLRSLDLPMIADADCARSYPEYDSAAMVCAGYLDGGRDACAGDSGGPLIAEGRVVGLVSWGDGCARQNSPGVYTRLIEYRTMLAQQTGV